jgi:hypothetical protein
VSNITTVVAAGVKQLRSLSRILVVTVVLIGALIGIVLQALVGMFNAIGRVSAEQTIDQSIADADVRCAFEMINSECTKGKASRSALPSICAACCTSDEYNIACCTSDECSVCPETFSSDQQQKRRQGLGHVDAHTGVTCATGLRCGCVCVSAQPTSAIPSHSPLECDRIGTRCAADAVGSAKCDDTREREAVRGGGRRAAQHACDGCAWNGCSVLLVAPQQSHAPLRCTLHLHR